MTDPLEDLPIEERNWIIDRADASEARAEAEAEARNERFWEEGLHGGQYAGSPEEARDRYLDYLNGL